MDLNQSKLTEFGGEDAETKWKNIIDLGLRGGQQENQISKSNILNWPNGKSESLNPTDGAIIMGDISKP